MTIPTSTFITDLGIQLGDPNFSVWPRAQILSFIKRAYRITGDYFFTIVVDDYTYTGTSLIAINTNEILVPPAFLSNGSTSEMASPGEVTGLKVRLTGTTSPASPNPRTWFNIAHAEIDSLTLPAPMIRFGQPYNDMFELKIYGWKHLTIPQADDTTALDGTDRRGFVEWLTFQTMVYCMAARETNTNSDKRGYGRRHLLDQADADKMRMRYRMAKPQYTRFTQIVR